MAIWSSKGERGRAYLAELKSHERSPQKEVSTPIWKAREVRFTYEGGEFRSEEHDVMRVAKDERD